MQLFYNSNLTPTSTQFTFDKEESRHIGKALRKQIGDILYLTDGKGHAYTAILENNNPKLCSVSIINVTAHPEASYTLHMAVAPTKLNDRFEWFLEKATEIGVTEITPIISHHSERKIIKQERYQKIIQSAAKQSLKYHFPTLNPLVSFDTFIKDQENNNAQKFIAHCQDINKTSLKSELKTKGNHIILIGPEGDFSIPEITLSKQYKYVGVSLGVNRLRTETAAIVACHSVAFLNEK